MNKWIRVLNFNGGMFFATGSLMFLQAVINQQSYSLQTAMCVNRADGCPGDILDKRQDLEKSVEGRQGTYLFIAMLGASLACLRESKD